MPSASRRVPNPEFQPDRGESFANPRTVAVQVRQSAIETLTKRGVLSNEQQQAARRFEHLFAAVELGRLRAIDPGKVVVDGGRSPDPIRPGQIDAVRELAGARQLLGKTCFAIVSSVCGLGHGLADAGLGSDKRATIVAASVLKFSLNDLARQWGFRR